MQVTLDIPNSLAAALAAAGNDPACSALEALEQWTQREIGDHDLASDSAEDAEIREAVRQGREDIAAGLTRPALEAFEELRQKYAIPC